MAANITQDGARPTVVAPAAVSSGDLVLVGTMFGIALTDAASAANVVIQTGVAADIPKTNAASMSMAAGAVVYWDNTGKKATTSATSNTKIGVALAAVSNTAETVNVRLNGSF